MEGQPLATALSALTNPPLDAVNPHFKSKFTSLAALLSHVRPILAEYGYAVAQQVGECHSGHVTVSTQILGPVTGTEMIVLTTRTTLPLPEGASPQQAGSAIKYARRYALLAILGIDGDDDDDGQAASQPAAPATAKAPVGRSPRSEAVDAFLDSHPNMKRIDVAKAQADLGIGANVAALSDGDWGMLREELERRSNVAQSTGGKP